ncbi:MAG: hypothetical protein SPE43_03125 [Ruminococcus sp.]|nr:hypothetical protein [Oscillospiraceae bacterium]MDY4413357.1 hypothetical protein [Ruminococcus sp.]
MTENNTSLSEIDRISILPYGETTTLKSVNFFIKASSVSVIADAVMMQKYLH